jgi:hypothetical protein
MLTPQTQSTKLAPTAIEQNHLTLARRRSIAAATTVP